MSEPSLTEHMVGLDGTLDVALVHADRHTHQHVLRPLHYFAVDSQKI